MHQSKLLKTIRLMDKAEGRAFSKYLTSPYFNHREDVIKLFDHLIKEYEAPELERGRVWEVVNGSIPFAMPDFNRLCSRLMKLLESFLALQAQPMSAAQERSALGSWYLENGEDGLAFAAFNEAEKALHKSKYRDSTHLLAVYQTAQVRYNASAQMRQRGGEGFREVSGDLDRWFIVEKLKHACSLVAQRNISDMDAPLEFLGEVLRQARDKEMAQEPVVEMYWRAYRMMVEENGAEEYRVLRSLLATHSPLLRLNEQRSVFLIAINFCIQELNLGRSVYLKEVYGLYLLGLNDGWLFEQGEVSPWTYKNIVSAGLKLGDFEGVAAFMENYRDKLPEASRGTFYKYNIAELEFAQGNFRETLRTLRYLQLKEPLTQLRIRILQIKAAYELEEMGMVEYEVANLLKLLRRKKSLAYHRESYREFARFARRLVLLWEGETGARISLQKELEGKMAVVEKDWLLSKLE